MGVGIVVNRLVLLTVLSLGVYGQSTFTQMIEEPDFNPISTLEIITVNGVAAYCKGTSMLPISYIVEVKTDNGSFKKVGSKFVFFEKVGSYVMVCTAKTLFGNKKFTRTMTSSWILRQTIDKQVKLIRGPSAAEGLVMFKYKDDWRYVCDDDFGIDRQSLINKDVVCRELGFVGARKVSTKGDYGVEDDDFFMDEVNCNGTEASLLDCASLQGKDQGDCNRKYDDPASVACSTDFLVSNYNYELQSVPALNIQINRDKKLLNVVCAYKSVLHQIHHVKLQKIWIDPISRAKKMEYVPLVANDITFTNEGATILFAYTYQYNPSLDEPVEFVCTVSDLLETARVNESITIEDHMENVTIRYDSESNTVVCEPNAANPRPTYNWVVPGPLNSGLNNKVLSVLDLDTRLPICCTAEQMFDNKTNVASKCITIKASGDKIERRILSFCDNMPPLDIECEGNKKVVLMNVMLGKFDTCTDKIMDKCPSHKFKDFMYSERYMDGKLKNIETEVMKLPYMKVHVDNFPKYCLKGRVPAMKVDYFCV